MTGSSFPASAPGRFNFGLSAAQEARAAKLHRESIVFDLLSQHAGGNIFAYYPKELQSEFRETLAVVEKSAALSEAVYWPFEMALQGKSDLVWEWFQQSGLTCGTFDIDLMMSGVSDLLSADWDTKIVRYSELPWLRYVTTAAQIRAAKDDGVLAMYANLQPVIPAPRDIRAFETAYKRGLRSFMLTYNRMDHIGVGCTERVDAGLSAFGVDVVRYCNEIGLIVDVSHCGRLTTIDACRYSSEPVTANHTSSSSIYPHPRGKSDEELRAIADTGGVIGVVDLPYFLCAEIAASIEHMLNHIDYIAGLVGWRHVAIGTDWPLQAPDDVLLSTIGTQAQKEQLGWSQRYRRDVTQRLNGYADCRDLPNITRGLVKRGYTDEQVQGIIGENALRVFEDICG